MQMDQAQGAEDTRLKPSEADNPQAKLLQERLDAVKNAISNQSPATRINLSGRFKVG